jgi:hypothetical protein
MPSVTPAATAASPSLRIRRWQKRRAWPVHVVYRLELEGNKVIQKLMDCGRIPPDDITTKKQVSGELSLLITEWLNGDNKMIAGMKRTKSNLAGSNNEQQRHHP